MRAEGNILKEESCSALYARGARGKRIMDLPLNKLPRGTLRERRERVCVRPVAATFPFPPSTEMEKPRRQRAMMSGCLLALAVRRIAARNDMTVV